MIKFLMKNKLQLLLAVITNLISFGFVLYVIALKLMSYNGIMSLCFGLMATYFFAINIKKYRKIIRLRVTVLYVAFIVLLVRISVLFLNAEDVLSGTGIFIGFLIFALVFNIADTIHNIREKASLNY